MAGAAHGSEKQGLLEASREDASGQPGSAAPSGSAPAPAACVTRQHLVGASIGSVVGLLLGILGTVLVVSLLSSRQAGSFLGPPGRPLPVVEGGGPAPGSQEQPGAFTPTEAEKEKARGVEFVSVPGCQNCAKAWDEEKVEDMCFGRAGAEMRRLGEEGTKGDEFHKVSRYPVRDTGGTFLYYGSQDLNEKQIAAKTMAIFIHGAGRNAQDYFCSLKKIIERSRLVNEETIMVVPKFSYLKDDHHQKDCVWNGSKPFGDWRAGGVTDPRCPCNISSFELFDYILKLAGDREKFPIMEAVKILGFSAGGQTVHRYSVVSYLAPPQLSSLEMYNAGTGIHPALRVAYVVGNPSSYAYLDNHRWRYDCTKEGCTEPEYALYSPRLGRRNWDQKRGFHKVDNISDDRTFQCVDGSFNMWGYGINWNDLDNPKIVPFLKKHPNLNRSVMEYYPNRRVAYLVGARDTCTGRLLPFCYDSCWRKDDKYHPCFSTIMDSRCAAMLQGTNRAQRARHYMRHLANFYGRPVHKLFEIPGVGHQAEVELVLAIEMKLNGELQRQRAMK